MLVAVQISMGRVKRRRCRGTGCIRFIKQQSRGSEQLPQSSHPHKLKDIPPAKFALFVRNTVVNLLFPNQQISQSVAVA